MTVTNTLACYGTNYVCKAVFQALKFSAIASEGPATAAAAAAAAVIATATCDCTCLGHLGHCDTNRNDPICIELTKVAMTNRESCITSKYH